MQPRQEGDNRLSFFEEIFDYEERGVARHVFGEPLKLPNGEWADEVALFFATWFYLRESEAQSQEVMYYEAQFSFATSRHPCRLRFRWLLDEIGSTQLLESVDEDITQQYCKSAEIDEMRGKFWNLEETINFLDHLLVYFTIPLGTEILAPDEPEFSRYRMDNDSSFTMPEKLRRT